jgi:hypothetical protein
MKFGELLGLGHHVRSMCSRGVVCFFVFVRYLWRCVCLRWCLGWHRWETEGHVNNEMVHAPRRMAFA